MAAPRLAHAVAPHGHFLLKVRVWLLHHCEVRKLNVCVCLWFFLPLRGKINGCTVQAQTLSVLFSECGRASVLGLQTPLAYRGPPSPGAFHCHALPAPLVFSTIDEFCQVECTLHVVVLPLVPAVGSVIAECPSRGHAVVSRSGSTHRPRAVSIWDS